MPNPRVIREARGVSQLAVAAEAKVSIPSVRLFEASNGQAVRDPHKRRALAEVYRRLAESAEQVSPPPSAA